MRRLLDAFYAVSGWTGISELFFPLNRQRPLIVTYHNVIPDELYDGALHLGVSHRLSEFKAQLELLAARFKVTADVLSREPGACVVTFDDGYRNNLLAAHELERIGARGIFFVPVEPVLSGRTLVIDQVLRWFSYVPPGAYSIGSWALAIGEEDRGGAYSVFYDWALRNAERWHELPRLLNDAYPYEKLPKLVDEYEDLRFRPMNRDELDSLRAAGHLVGCHSYDHRPLRALSDAALNSDFKLCSQHRELFNSVTYSFPFGGPDEVDERAIELCRLHGYSSAVMNVSAGWDDLMRLPRMMLPNSTDVHILNAKLSGLEAALKRMLSH